MVFMIVHDADWKTLQFSWEQRDAPKPAITGATSHHLQQSWAQVMTGGACKWHIVLPKNSIDSPDLPAVCLFENYSTLFICIIFASMFWYRDTFGWNSKKYVAKCGYRCKSPISYLYTIYFWEPWKIYPLRRFFRVPNPHATTSQVEPPLKCGPRS